MKRFAWLAILCVGCAAHEPSDKGGWKVTHFPPGSASVTWRHARYLDDYPFRVSFQDAETGRQVTLYGSIRIEADE